MTVSQGLTSGATRVEFDSIAGAPEYDRGVSSTTSYTTSSNVQDNQFYSYRSRMWDNSGNYSNFGAVGNIFVGDRTAPSITGITGNTSSTTGEARTITATLNDNVGVTASTLYYTPIDGSGTSLNFIGGSANVPVAADKVGTITYYVTAFDTAGNNSRSPSSGSYAITVTDNDPPTADPNGPYTVDEASVLTFDGTGSTDNIGVVRYDWDYGDTNTGTDVGATPSHTYADNGTYTVALTVYDNAGNNHTATATVTVNNVAPSITLNYPTGGEVVSGSIDITWTASDVADTLTMDIYYTMDNGSPFTIAAGETNDGSYTWDTTAGGGDSDKYRIMVVADDATTTTSAQSGFFTVDNNPLTITPLTPEPLILNANFGEQTIIPYLISEPATMTISIFDMAATWINDITIGSSEVGGGNSHEWDGTDSLGNVLNGGQYYFQVTGVDSLGNVVIMNSPDTIRIIGQKPVISGLSEVPDPFSPSTGETGVLSYNLFTRDNPPKFTTLQTDITISDADGNPVRTLFSGVETGSSTGNNYSKIWDGTDDSAVVVPPGVYTYTITAVRTANGGNPNAKQANPKTGVIEVIDSAMGYVESADAVVNIDYNPASLTFTIDIDPPISTDASFALFSNGSYLLSSIYDINPDSPITPPAVMTFNYSVPLYGGEVGLYRYNTSTGLWEQVTSAVVDEANNCIIANIQQFSLYAVLLKGEENPVIDASVTVKPEVLKVNPGTLTAFVSLPAPYSPADIASVTCDGAAYESLELSEDGDYMVVKFRRPAIEQALAQQGESLDTGFEITGTLIDGTWFMGHDTIKKIVSKK